MTEFWLYFSEELFPIGLTQTYFLEIFSSIAQ